MNERIKSLIDQAGGEFWTRLEGDVVKQDAYITFDPPQGLEKLIELIVLECIDTVTDCSVEHCTRSQIANELKEHFEIK